MTPATIAVFVGETLQLTAIVKDVGGAVLSDVEVTWATADSSVATVSASGLVAGTGRGVTDVRAMASARSATARVEVLRVPVSSVTISPSAVDFVEGDTLQLVAVARDSVGNELADRVIDWSISDPAVAEVAQDGRSIARLAGSATVFAAAEGRRDSAVVAVRPRAGPFTSAAISGSATCGLAGTSAFCWGANSRGQLGIGTMNGPQTCGGISCAPIPVAVEGGLVFGSIVSGFDHTCGLVAGSAYCWGGNFLGEHGTGDAVHSATPRATVGGIAFATLSAYPATIFTCGLAVDGSAYCWGANDVGQLGIGTATGPEQCSGDPCSTTPVKVVGNLSFTDLSLGDNHACGLVAGGTAYCWGSGRHGFLGNGDTVDAYAPVAVGGGLTFATLHAGTCGLTSDGTAYCWGWNEFGRVGDGSQEDRTVPAPVAGGLVFERLSVGAFHACGVTQGGDTYCWGGNQFGQLGAAADGSCGSVACRTTPGKLERGIAFSEVIAGWVHSCGLTGNGGLYCWGNNLHGQLGIGTTASTQRPLRVIDQ